MIIINKEHSFTNAVEVLPMRSSQYVFALSQCHYNLYNS